MSRIIIMLVLAIAVIPVSMAEPMRIGVSLLPLETLVREIGGDSVEVQSLQREGDSCSVFEPRPSSISWLSTARAFFRIGAGYEPAIMNKIQSQYAGLKVVDLREAVQVEESQHHHDHAHDHECQSCSSHGDPHVWLDPVRLIALAERVARELGTLMPQNKQRYEAAVSDFSKLMNQVHQQLAAKLNQYDGKAFYIYHPALGYFAERYHLQQIAIAQTNQGPSARQLHDLINQARNMNIRAVFVQPQESRRHAEIVAHAIGAEVIEIDPMSTDITANLVRIGNSLADSFRKE